MRKTLMWRNPSNTSLGDRLLDTMLVSTLCSILDADLYFPWVDCPFVAGSSNPTYTYREGEQRSWDRVRFEDYKFEVYSEYFNLPKNIKINQVANQPSYFFDSALGGCVSPYLFYYNFVSNICSLDTFETAFRHTISEFTPTDKLLNLVAGKPKPDVSVHLRRTDKINSLGDYKTFIPYEGLVELNKRTIEAIKKLYNDSRTFYFSSDDINERIVYENMFANHLVHDSTCTDVEKTYIDLYTLAYSEYIILSQVHSNFSVFASYINNAKLIYLYDKCLIVDQHFNRSNNFIYYKDLI